MANRVVLDVNGLRVSKPGFNAVSTSANNLLFDSNWDMLQVIASGQVSGSGSISWQNLGYAPYIIIYAPNGAPYLTYTSSTGANLALNSGTGNIYWAVTKLPRLM